MLIHGCLLFLLWFVGWVGVHTVCQVEQLSSGGEHLRRQLGRTLGWPTAEAGGCAARILWWLRWRGLGVHLAFRVARGADAEETVNERGTICEV